MLRFIGKLIQQKAFFQFCGNYYRPKVSLVCGKSGGREVHESLAYFSAAVKRKEEEECRRASCNAKRVCESRETLDPLAPRLPLSARSKDRGPSTRSNARSAQRSLKMTGGNLAQNDRRKQSRILPRVESTTTGPRSRYAKAGITSRANSSTVCGGAMSANMIVNIVMPHATRSHNCLITSSGVPFTAVNENGLRPLAISHF